MKTQSQWSAISARPLAASRARRSFTLTELLVVMGIIALLSAMTAVGYRAIAKDAKLSSGKNTLMAVLDNARGLAMKNNQIVLVVFRARLDGPHAQYLEAIVAKSGQTARVTAFGNEQAVDRFVPIPGVPPRALPNGIGIASPFYGDSTPGSDYLWKTCTYLPAVDQITGSGEEPGRIFAVMFAADGTVVGQNPSTDSSRIWVDFDNDGKQRISGSSAAPNIVDYFDNVLDVMNSAQFNYQYFLQRYEQDESYVNIAPFVAVFDHDKARERYDVSRWNTAQSGTAANREADYTQFITNESERIHFNRYTGVVMK